MIFSSVTIADIKISQKPNFDLSKKTICKPGLSLTKYTIDLFGFAFKINSINSVSNFKCVSCIYYLVYFSKNWNNIKALINLGSDVNSICLIYAKKIKLFNQKIDIGIQKIDGFTLAILGIVNAAFLIKNKDEKIRFFETTFLLANISLDMVFKIFFLT